MTPLQGVNGPRSRWSCGSPSSGRAPDGAHRALDDVFAGSGLRHPRGDASGEVLAVAPRKDERGEGAERVVAVEVAVGGAQADEQAERLFGEAIGVEAGARCAYEFDGGTRYWWGSPFHRG